MKNDQQVIEDLVIVKLSVSAWYGKIKCPEAESEIETAHSAKRGTSDVKIQHLPNDYVSGIRTAASRMRTFFDDRTLPWQDGGYRIVPTIRYAELMDGIASLKTDEFEPAVERLISDYDSVQEQARVKLNGLFQGEKFPTRQQLQSKYGVSVYQSAITNPDDVRFRGLKAGEVDEIKETMRREIAAQIEATLQNLVERLRGVVSEVVSRLGRDPEKERVKYKGLWRTLNDVCDTLPGLNITNNEKLNQFIERVKIKLAKWNPEIVRTNARCRETLRKEATDILSELDSFSA